MRPRPRRARARARAHTEAPPPPCSHEGPAWRPQAPSCGLPRRQLHQRLPASTQVTAPPPRLSVGCYVGHPTTSKPHPPSSPPRPRHTPVPTRTGTWPHACTHGPMRPCTRVHTCTAPAQPSAHSHGTVVHQPDKANGEGVATPRPLRPGSSPCPVSWEAAAGMRKGKVGAVSAQFCLLLDPGHSLGHPFAASASLPPTAGVGGGADCRLGGSLGEQRPRGSLCHPPLCRCAPAGSLCRCAPGAAHALPKRTPPLGTQRLGREHRGRGPVKPPELQEAPGLALTEPPASARARVKHRPHPRPRIAGTEAPRARGTSARGRGAEEAGSPSNSGK